VIAPRLGPGRAEPGRLRLVALGTVPDVASRAACPATRIHVDPPPLATMTCNDPHARVPSRIQATDDVAPMPDPPASAGRARPLAGGRQVTGPPSGVDRLLARARSAIAPRPGPVDLEAVRDAGGLVVDIRPVELRRRDGDLPGALVVDRNVLEWWLDPTSAHRLDEVTGPDQPIVLVCDEGYASSLAAATLRELGLRRATDLDGGYQAWLRTRAGARVREPR
jgi:rhodanese-related sulfurtransferase